MASTMLFLRYERAISSFDVWKAFTPVHDPKLSSANIFLKYILVCISQKMIIMFR